MKNKHKLLVIHYKMAYNKKSYESAPPAYYATNPNNCQAQNQQSGIFGSFSKVLSDVGSTLDGAARDLTNAIDKVSSGSIIDTMCRTGNVIQLSPKNFGNCIQILADASGYLYVDPNGPVHPQAYNTHWTVYMEPGFNNIVKLYNQVNYLSIANNRLSLVQASSPAAAPLSTRFRVRQNDFFLSFESLLCPKYFISFDVTHNTIAAKDVSLFSNASYFHPTLVYSPVNQARR